MRLKASKVNPGEEQSHGVDTLMPLIYAEVRRMASARFRSERPEHTLQPTAVANEAYLRVKETAKRTERRWNSEAEFKVYVAPVIRRVLVDYARSGPQNTRVDLTSWDTINAGDEHSPDLEILALHEILSRMEKQDVELGRIVELHYFGGLTVAETADAVGLSEGTLKDRLKFALTWLRQQLNKVSKA